MKCLKESVAWDRHTVRDHSLKKNASNGRCHAAIVSLAFFLSIYG